VVNMRGSKHDACDALVRHLLEIGPARRPPAAITPGPQTGIEPASIWQAEDRGPVLSPAPLAGSASALETDAPAQLRPVRWI
jgi:hypothetical protein